MTIRNDGASGNSFETISTPLGDLSVVADSSNDTLILTSSTGEIDIAATQATDTINFTIDKTIAYTWTGQHIFHTPPSSPATSSNPLYVNSERWGASADTQAPNAVALGYLALASGDGSGAFGLGAQATEGEATACGTNTISNGFYSSIVGSTSNIGAGLESCNILGAYSTIESTQCQIMGSFSSISTGSDNCVLMGSASSIGVNVDDGVLIGYQSSITTTGGGSMNGSILIGSGTTMTQASFTGSNNIIVGNSTALSGTTASNFILIGHDNTSTGGSSSAPNVFLGDAISDGGFNGLTIIGGGGGTAVTATASNQLIFPQANSIYFGRLTQTGAVGTKAIRITTRTTSGAGNNAAGTLEIRGGLGTGAGALGNIVFYTGITASAGVQHTEGERLRFGTGELVVNDNSLAYNFRIEGDADANLFFTDGTNDRVGIGTNAPTAFLHLKAGTATANTAPLKFTSGTNLTSPEAGVFEYDGKNLHFTKTSNRRKVVQGNDAVSSGTTVANTTTETTIFTTTIPANETAAADVVRVHAMGHYSAVSAAKYTLRVKVAGTTVLTYDSPTDNGTNAPWHITANLSWRTIGGTGTVIGFLESDANSSNRDVANTATTTVNTTASQAVTVTIQWDAASASNTLTQTIAYAEVI